MVCALLCIFVSFRTIRFLGRPIDGSVAKVIDARKRVLVMEYIRGGRVDDIEYLADHDIDRNKVSVELAHIFSQMVHINGWFHAVRAFFSVYR